MTRWARSKGSAASNERTEEEATPWSQLVAGIRRNAAESNVEDIEGQDDFEVGDDEQPQTEAVDNGRPAANKGQATADNEKDGDDDEEEDEDEKEDIEETVSGEKKEKKKVELIEQSEEPTEKSKKKKKKRSQDKCLNCKEKGHLKKECPQLTEERRKELQELYTMKIERKGHGTGRKKNKRKAADALGGDNDKKEQEVGEEGGEDAPNNEASSSSSSPTKKPRREKGGGERGDGKKWKGREGGRGPAPPKKPLVDITGQTVQEDEGLFQGFRVKKEAVKKLKSMQAQLKAEERPETEIAETMKRERRKAERELAKFRKMVCFNCRQSGHLLIDCPQQKKENSGGDASKVQAGNHCFKCGSKDHTSKDCVSKRKGKDAYAFATCFICKETGHLAKSCPDNPRGLYPKGGGCRFCGSVEHLKADCSRKIQKDEKLEVKVGMMSNGGGGGGNSLEEIVDDRRQTQNQDNSKFQKKVVKF